MVLSPQLIDNLTQSWTFAALQQVLGETATLSLPVSKFLQDASTGSSGKMQPYGDRSREQKLSFAEPKTMIHPARSSSLSHGTRPASAEPPYSQSSSGQVVYENGQYRDPPVPTQDGPPSQMKTGLQELAGARAQLHAVQRRILEHVGKSQGWVIGWAAIMSPSSQTELTDVDLDDKSDSEENTPAENPTKGPSTTVGISAAALVNAMSSIDKFREYYEVG